MSSPSGALKFVHLTDPHLVPPGERLYGLDPAERLRAAIDDINRHHPDAAFALVTGDLAHRGQVEAYRVLAELVAGLSVPCHLVLGNHDDRQAFRHVFPGVPVDDHGFVQYRIETPAGIFLVLDTVEDGTHVGRLCPRRLAWLERQLTATRGAAAYICMHHPPFAVGLPSMDPLRLAEESEFGAALARHGHVRHLFFGHLHRPVSGAWRDISFSTLPATNHQVGLDFTRHDGVPGSHEPPAYSIVMITLDAIIIHTHDYLDEGPRFELFDRRAERAFDLLELT